MNKYQSTNLRVTKHAFQRAEARFGWDHQDTLEMLWAAKEHGADTENDDLEYDGYVFKIINEKVTTIVTYRPTVKPKRGPTINSHILKVGDNELSLPKDVRILGLDIVDDDGEFVLHTIENSGVKHVRKIVCARTGEKPPKDGEYIGSIDGLHAFDMGFEKVDV